MKILLADDEQSIRQLIEHIVSKLGHEPISAANGREALELYESERPLLAILDIMMPLVDGFEVCEKIKADDPDLPVLFLTAKGDISDKRIGFTLGADDYLTKPFNPEELKLRIEALIRRATRSANGSSPSSSMPAVAAVQGLAFNEMRMSVTVYGTEVQLTSTEYRMLSLLASNPGAVFSAEDLIERLWGSEYLEGSINIPAYIRRIRTKIEANPARPAILKTAWGSGYYLTPDK